MSNKKTKRNEEKRTRPLSPFDDSAGERLKRMGLLGDNDQPDINAVVAMATVFGGQFFDDLCDYHHDYELVKKTISRFIEDTEGADPLPKFLMLCLQYDAIYVQLPDPIWWISGNLEVASVFVEAFITHLSELVSKEGE